MAQLDGAPCRTGVDSYAEISMILSTRVNKEWTVLEDKGIDLRGIGRANTGPLVLVPISYRCGMEPEHLTMRVVDSEVMPKDLEVLIGTKAQHESGMTIHAGTSRLTIQSRSVTIDTEPVGKILARQKSKPLNVLALAGGMSPAILILTDLGWRINKYHSSDTCKAAPTSVKFSGTHSRSKDRAPTKPGGTVIRTNRDTIRPNTCLTTLQRV